jgi:PAS domain S-box-containing protein
MDKLNKLTISMDKILDSIPHGITVQNRAGEIIYANRMALKLIGLTAERIYDKKSLAKQLDKFVLKTEDDKPLKLTSLPGRKALRSGVTQEQVLRFKIKKTGQEYWSLVKADPVIEKGKVQGVINSFYDLTAIKTTEQELKLLSETSSAMASALTYEARLNKLAKIMIPRIADWCVIDIVDMEGNIHLSTAEHAFPEKEVLIKKLHRGLFHTQLKSPVWQVIRTTRPKIFNGSQLKKIFERAQTNQEYQEIIHSLNFRSMVILPLIARSKTLGAITFVTSDSHRMLTDESLPFLKRLTNKVALLADNARLYSIMVREMEKQKIVQTALRQREQTLNLALEAGEMLTWEWDNLSKTIKWSDHVKSDGMGDKLVFNGPTEDFLELVEVPEKDFFTEKLEAALLNGGNFSAEIKINFPHRPRQWTYIQGHAIPDRRGNPTRMVGIGIDITERKMNEP